MQNSAEHWRIQANWDLFVQVWAGIQGTATQTESWVNLPRKAHTVNVSCCPPGCIYVQGSGLYIQEFSDPEVTWDSAS